MKKTILSASLLLALAACNGPWNMMPESSDSAPRLWVSSFAVADLPFDTLWMERPMGIEQGYDSTAMFVDTAASRVLVIREDLADTIEYRLAPGSGVAWLPTERAIVARGATYRLSAKVRWTTVSGDQREDEISASTTVPKVYEILPWALAPIEALAPWVGGLAKVSDASSERRAILDRLDATDATLDSVRANLPVYRLVQKEDTIWYIHDDGEVKDLLGTTVQRTFRTYLFGQKIRRSDWWGKLVTQNFDTTGQYIENIVTKQLYSSVGKKVDSFALYQKGNLRTLDMKPAFTDQRYPAEVQTIVDTLAKVFGGDVEPYAMSNAYFAYTGRSVQRFYALDRNHYEYYRRQGTDANSLRWSAVRNGDGYFSSAVVDSFPLYVRATQDTFSVPELHKAWCREQKKQAEKDRKPWKSVGICAGI